MNSVVEDQVLSAGAWIDEAAAGRVGWQETLEAIARALGVQRVSIESLNGADASASPLFASPQFAARWDEVYGPSPRRISTVRPELEPGVASLFIAIDTPANFYALAIEGLSSLDKLDEILDCARRLGPALQTEQRILSCQQDFALCLLNSGGTAAFVLGSDGSTVKMNECARLLLAECRQARPGKGEADIAALLELDMTRLAQSNVVAPSGRRLMTYIASWSSSMPFSRQRLLVAWDIRIDAPMTSYWGDKTMDAVARAIRETFGLTKTESQLAVRLMGSDLRTAAADAGMAYETARSHLKSMFARMKVKSQSELIGLLSRFAYHERLRNTFGG